MTLARKILGNTVAQVAGRFATAFLAIVVIKILTVYLGQAGYGQYATIYEFLAFFGAFADFGIFTIAVREMSKYKKKEKEIFGNTIVLRTLFTAFFMLLASIAVFFIPQYHNTLIPLGVCIAAFSTFFVILSGTLSAALQIKLRMGLSAFALVLGKVFTVAFIIFLTQWLYPTGNEKAFLWLITAGSLGAMITFLITLFVTYRTFPFRLYFSWKESKKILIEAAPFAIALALNTFYIRMDILLLSLLLPISENGTCLHNFCSDTEIGIYAVGARILEIFLMVPIYFMNSVLPTLTQYVSSSSKKIEELLQNAFLFLLVIGLACGIGLFVLAKEITRIISSPEFLETAEHAGSDTAFRILAIIIPIAFISLFFGFFLIASGKQKFLIWINLGTVMCNLFLDIYAIPHYGFEGAAWASVASECVMLLLMTFVATRVIRFTFPFFLFVRTIFIAIITATLVSIFHEWFSHFSFLLSFFLTGIFFICIYSLFLFLFRVVHYDIFQKIYKKNI